MFLTSAGAITWQKTYGGSYDDSANSIQQVALGRYIVAGRTAAFASYIDDMWILRLSSTGDIIWQKTYGGAGDEEAQFIRQTPDIGYIVAGVTDTFGAGAQDAMVMKLDGYGDILSSCEFIADTNATPVDSTATVTATTVAPVVPTS